MRRCVWWVHFAIVMKDIRGGVGGMQSPSCCLCPDCTQCAPSICNSERFTAFSMDMELLWKRTLFKAF